MKYVKVNINNKIRHTKQYKKWRDKVIKRDKYKCQVCNEYFQKSRLNVHHIKSLDFLINNYICEFVNCEDDYFYDIDNGLTVCVECHYKVFHPEKQKRNIEMNSNYSKIPLEVCLKHRRQRVNRKDWSVLMFSTSDRSFFTNRVYDIKEVLCDKCDHCLAVKYLADRGICYEDYRNTELL